jgi:hypothetical protein
MKILRPACALTICLALASACAPRTPLRGPAPAAVRTTIEAQIAQVVPGEDTMTTALRR